MSKSLLSIEMVNKNTIYHRYLENGSREEEYIEFKPFCGVITDKKSSIKTLYNKPLELRKFDNISEFKKWTRENEDYIDIYGNIRPEYMFLSSVYREEIPLQWDDMRIDNFDIEVVREDGFPDAQIADWPVTAITIQDVIKKTYTTFGFKNYVNHDQKRINYIHCDDEKDLLKKYIAYCVERRPDILTGWNIVNFDIPYMVNRIKKVLGKSWANKISPIGKLRAREYKDTFENEINTYDILGTVIYDYMELYSKFQFEPRDGKSLEVIAQAELGKGKLDYKKGDNRSLTELYHNDFQTYIDYNIRDTELVGLIDDKRGYLRLAINMTYMAKCLFSDVFGTVGIWDAYLYNILLNKKILCPPRKTNIKSSFPGGWVEKPHKGLNGWNMVFDIASSYPNSIISYNISTETIIEFSSLPKELQNLADSIRPFYSQGESTWLINDKIYDVDWLEENAKELLEKYDLCMTPWGEFFRRNEIGFIPEVVDKIFKSRKKVKGEMKTIDFSSNEYAALNAQQMAFKTLMNSLYGAMSNIWFRYFDIRMAGSITCAGQASVKGSSKYIQDNIKGMKNFYTDTDSIFLDLQPFIDARFKNKEHTFVDEHDFCMKLSTQLVEPKLTEFFDRLTKGLNTFTNTLTMESEVLADAWISVEKKKYSMRIINDEGEEFFNRETLELGKWNFDKTEFEVGKVKLKTKGLSLIQSTTPQFSRSKLKQSLELIFQYRDQEVIKDKFKEWKDEFMTLPFEEISMPRGVTIFNKYVENPAGAQAHVRSAIAFNKALIDLKLDKTFQKINQGDKIRYAYIEVPNIFGIEVMAVKDKMPELINNNIKVNWDIQWQKCFTSQLEKIFETIGWNISEDDVSLEDFFS